MDLHVKYRPTELDEVVGQDAVVRSLKRLLSQESLPHAFLFSGPSGVGKTTLARIIARMTKSQVIEVDAATYTGIDAVRSLTETLPYEPLMGGYAAKCIILDEAHALSRQSWQALLKIVEEPPPHVYFCFCTTEVDKVPRTILTRTHHYTLQPVPGRVIEEHLLHIAKREQLKVPVEVVEWIARTSYGSVRQALVSLSMCHGAKSVDEAKRILSQSQGAEEPVELFRLLVSGRAQWKECVARLERLEKGEGFSYESLRIGLVNYVGAALLNTKNAEDAHPLLAILEAFAQPLPRATERASFLLALGKLLA